MIRASARFREGWPVSSLHAHCPPPDRTAQAAGEKAYGLLKRAPSDSGRAALAKVILRHQETPALIRVVDDCLTRHLLAYPDEIRPTGALNRGAAEVSDKELALANLLVESMTTDCDPGALHDERKARLEAKRRKSA